MDPVSPAGPRVAWPANHRAALVVLVHVDAPALNGANPDPPTGLDYAATGLQRLLALLTDLDVPATTAWSPSALASLPQLARRAQDAGHELAVSRATGDASRMDESLLSRISDIAPVGAVQSLPDSGKPVEEHAEGHGELSWVINGAGGDLPILTAGRGRPDLAVIPVSPYWVDTAWLAPDRPLPPSSFLEAWSLGLAAVRSEGGLMVVVLHPHVSGRPGFSSQIERFLDEAIGSGDVWIATAARVAEWWRRHDDAGEADR